MDLMRAAGLEPRVDPAGNIFGRRAGTRAVAAADPLRLAHRLGAERRQLRRRSRIARGARRRSKRASAAGLRTRHPLEMVVWSAEEGVAFGRGLAGSRIVAGDVTPADMDAVWNGLRRADGVRKLGGDPDRIMDAVRPKGAHHAYLELHIEQGGTLDARRTPIGVVEGIVAIERYSAVVTGFANHAGTTPMAERQDALVAASQLTLAVRESVTRKPGRQVGTVGQLDVSPNAPNVIPGDGPADDRAARPVDGHAAAGLPPTFARARRQIAARHEDDDRDRGSQPQSAGAGVAGGAARDRTRGG